MRSRSRPRPRKARPADLRVRPVVERCEPRQLLATFTVTTTADDGPGSLRAAITQVDLDQTPDLIQFAIGGGGSQIIRPASPLPAITNAVTIDGTTQPGYVNAPLVIIDGTNAGFIADGLTVQAAGTTVEGLSIGNFNGSGIVIQNVGGCVIRSNDLGVEPGSSFTQLFQSAPNTGDGVFLSNASGNTIGQPGAGNTIGSNGQNGIDVAVGSTNELIQGNFLGTAPGRSSVGGPVNLGNGTDGVFLNSATGTTIGGTSSGAGNLISANIGYGVEVASGSGNLILGNRVGIGSSGLTGLGNGFGGVALENSSGNTVGGPTTLAANVISGNTGDGVSVLQAGSTRNAIQGNIIGLGTDGLARIANTGNGIRLDGAPGNFVVSNLVAENRGAGVFINNTGAADNLVVGNQIGINSEANGDANATDGVFILAAPGNTIGGTSTADRNVISGNGGNGVSIRGLHATGNLVQGNFIGTDPSGNIGNLVGNIIDGVFIKNASGNTIGGTAAGAGNVIAQDRIGVDIESFDNASLAPNETDLENSTSNNNVIQGNLIGTDASGTQPVGNYGEGVLIVDGSGNQVGGSAAGAGNVISANLLDGVSIISEELTLNPTSGNSVQGNIIGLTGNGLGGLGNGQVGIRVTGGSDTTIGGTTTDAANVVSGNSVGLDIIGTTPGTSMGVLIQGNIIGLGLDGFTTTGSVSGSLPIGNTGNGITVEQGAAGVTIGGNTPGSGNVISGNSSSGILFATASTDDLVQGNIIGLAKDGLTQRPNIQSGIFLSQGSNAVTVGGTAANSGNIIGGNATGVTLTNSGTTNNLFLGNIVGLGIDGTTAVGNVAYGFLLLGGADGNTIGGSAPGSRNVISSNGQGITADGPGLSGNVFQGNYIGVDATGSGASPNDRAGIAINDSPGNTIGGTASGAGNVISANTGPGVVIDGSTSTGNLVVGNIVGLDATGTRANAPSGLPLGNTNYGISIDSAPNNTIGGETPGSRNVISGNLQSGISVNGIGSVGTIIQGNDVGLDATGLHAFGNLAEGVLLVNAPGVVVGGGSGHDGNVISGNQGDGITINGAGSVFDLVAGNLIGTDATGGAVLSNILTGVYVNGAPGVTIGGTIATLRNVISANGQYGVRVAGTGSATTAVLGNLIGTDATGEAALGNLLDGVFLDGSTGVTVGGTTPGSTNIISANAGSGVEFGGNGTTGNVLSGNLIGTDASGRFALANSIGVFLNNAPLNEVGGTSPFSGNLISGNSGAGLEIFGVGATNNQVQGNRIGTNLAGLAGLANQAGVFIDGSADNLVGGLTSGSGNVISGNLTGGVILQNTGASGNLVQGNLIGLDATGTRVIAGSSSQQQSGVLLTDAPDNVIGGSTPLSRNVISGNVVGVVIAGFNAQGNLVIGDSIGTDVAGTRSLANTVGVYINGSSSNTIGGSTAGFGNLISGNSTTGLTLFGPQTTLNVVAGNEIGTNLAGTLAVPNQEGVYIEDAPSNTIGGPTKAAGNLISGNSVAGVYLYNGASANLIQDNRIGFTQAGGPLGNLQYGILFYNAADNVNDTSATTGNTIGNSGIGNFREFTGPVATTTTTTAAAVTKVTAKAAHPKGPKSSSRIS